MKNTLKRIPTSVRITTRNSFPAFRKKEGELPFFPELLRKQQNNFKYRTNSPVLMEVSETERSSLV